MRDFDHVLVGGGLQNGLLTLALLRRNPDARVAIVEQGERLGGNHTWCFHAGDVPTEAAAFVDPLIVQRWPGYSVHFPGSERHLAEPYAAVTSDRLHDVVTELAQASQNVSLLLGKRAASIAPHRVVLTTGETLNAELVVDARGPEAFAANGAAGYQKFLGWELEVEPETSPALPTIMDARVPQSDGFRFFYVLPLAADRVLVEDTYFSDSPELDSATLRPEIARYAAKLGLGVRRLVREEAGVLPLPTRALRAPPPVRGLVHGGYQGGWFHPTTGYSFPLAVRFASEVAGARDGQLTARLTALGKERARQQRFCALLNRMLFGAFAPEQRFHVLSRFYGLPVPTVRRFYALALTPADRLRIVCGRPPAGFSPSRFFSPDTTRHDTEGEIA